MKLLRIIFFISLFVLTYLVFYKIYAKKQALKLKVNKIEENKLFVLILNFSKKFIPDINNIFAYVISKLVLLITFFYLGINNYGSVLVAIMFSIAGFSIPDIMIKIMKNSEKKQILTDLLNVVECIKIQMTANIPLLIALKNTPELCKNEKFKNLLIDMYLEYELNGYSLSCAINKMKKKLPFLEINMFSSAIEQQIKYGQANETYENLVSILKEKYIEYIENGTQSKMTLMTVGIIIVLINLAVMGSYPIIVEVNRNLISILS